MTTEQQLFIVENRLKMSVPMIAKELKVGPATVYNFLKANNLKWITVPYSPARTHPFRQMNRSLRQQIIEGKNFGKQTKI